MSIHFSLLDLNGQQKKKKKSMADVVHRSTSHSHLSHFGKDKKALRKTAVLFSPPSFTAHSYSISEVYYWVMNFSFKLHKKK